MKNLQLSTPDATLDPITLAESQRFVALETTIKKGREAFLAVAVALSEIRDSRLYRSDYPTFELYCREKWGFTRQYVNQAIAGAEAVKSLPAGMETIVSNQGQARALAKVPEELRGEVLEATVKSGKPITAKTITEAAGEVIPPPASEADWLPDERQRQGLVLSGKTVVANFHRDHRLIKWAQSQGLFTLVDRRTDFGNPFISPGDGDRDEVCDKYSKFYLPHKPTLLKRIPELRGRVLGCWCYPLRCHGDDPAARANERGEVV